MARIRSDKPESYQSETLAEISLAAERTFRGMATIADDRGRLADKPAQINGELWSMRSEREPHTRDDLEAELQEMLKADLICRYTGCDGKRYVHLVKWDAHQKIDRPSKSRLPRCPFHQVTPDYCGLHEGECILPEVSPTSPEPSRDSREPSRDLQPTQNGHAETVMPSGHLDQGELIAVEPRYASPDGQNSVNQGNRKPSRESREGSMQDLGSRTVDRGSRTVKDAAPAKPETPNQRANRLARVYTDQVKISNFPAIAKIVRKAVDANLADEVIVDGLEKVIADGVSLTTESLRKAIYGQPKGVRQQETDSQFDRALQRAEMRESQR